MVASYLDSNVTRMVDARGVAVSTTYDVLDRPLARYQGDPATGTMLAEWLYDTRV